jgi:hypothetical protein
MSRSRIVRIKDKRSRIVRIKDKIIITNFKCMFTSLNKLNICELNPSDSEKYEKIMLFRNPYNRTISCFLNWMIHLPKGTGVIKNSQEQIMCEDEKNGWLIPILLKESDFDFNNYKVLLEENNLIELFKIYIKLLPKIKNNNAHMHSQVKIIKNKFNIDIFINIDKKGDIMILKEKIKQDLSISNKSSDKDKQLCEKFINNDINYKNIIYDIYKDDFEFLPIE